MDSLGWRESVHTRRLAKLSSAKIGNKLARKQARLPDLGGFFGHRLRTRM